MLVFLFFSGCKINANESANSAKDTQNISEEKISESASGGNDAEKVEESSETTFSNSTETNLLQTKEPKTVMDFFALLPQKYFTLEGCEPENDKNCKKARADYLKTYKEVEDIKNGYFKAGCDGAQSCIEMAIFKRPDSTYMIALATFSEGMEENYFLDYKNGSWTDISTKIVPEFSKDKRYEIPRNGTTVKVFSTKLIEKGDDYEIREKDKNIYDLEWKDGKFQRQK